ncbi:hypothetical protein SC206_19070 [Rouxiella sp. T17]|uniref:hypothetical protein n=1 Tax=Rouxiella sp. T17 TaxID=3085684 RepID=UPI002FC8CB6E
MNFDELIRVIGIKHTPLELTPEFTVYIKLPTVRDYAKCNSSSSTILHCIVDEEGKPIFKDEEQVEQVDFKYHTLMSNEINKILLEQIGSDTEKK